MARRLSRRAFLRAVPAGLGVVAVACGFGHPGDPFSQLPGPPPVAPPGSRVRPGCRLGATAADLPSLERSLGAPLGMHRVFHTGEEWPDERDRRAVAGGRALFATFKSFEGSTLRTWPEVAEGAFDAKLRRIAAGVRTLPGPVFLDYHAEPEADEGPFGSRSDYVAAVKRIIRVTREEGATDVRWGWCLGGFQFEYPSTADSWYPGDRYIDVVAADAYNWAGCAASPDGTARHRAWSSFADRFGAAVAYAEVHGKPFIAAEVGCPEDPTDPERKAGWIRDMGAYVQTRPGIRAVCWFDHGRADGFRCDWWIDSSPASLAAFGQLLADPYFAGSPLRELHSPRPEPDLTQSS